MERKRKFYGWGFAGEGLTEEEERRALATCARLFDTDHFEEKAVPGLAEIRLPAPRVAPPEPLAPICSAEPYDRALHSFGKSYPDTVRGMLGDYAAAPDVVAYPRDEADIARVIDWAGGVPATLTPFGGGSSVVGGVEPALGRKGAKASVTLDLSRMNQVLEIDPVSRAGRFAGGIFGPALETALRPHGLTLRHFPQSFEHSTLGGWIATRSAGHFASLRTHIDDFVESLRVVTPRGTLQTRRLPGSGAGPSPDRLFIGSEGTLGVISEAWVRLTPRPSFRAGSALWFPDFFAAARAVRAILQAGLTPANCRILDPEEARNTGAGDGRAALMVLGFEGWDGPLTDLHARALACAADHGGRVEAETTAPGAAEKWRTAFIRMPYLREILVPRAIIADTFETAITWDRFEALHAAVTKATLASIRAVTGRPGAITCRFTHVYPDGPAPYFTFHALGRHGALIPQWQAIKEAASEALLAAGGTITHHHAVGRDHRPWYDRQRPDLFAAGFRAMKAALDPAGLFNPGVLIDP
ncbi:MAG TPA: FAD-binding oxidoreductase [Acetobacteraceae bacterium]|nr:FAD-binding oxidoreductase [Acetobacteraceae bacterium]